MGKSSDDKDSDTTLSRRNFLAIAGTAAALPLANLLPGVLPEAAASSTPAPRGKRSPGKRPNILFVFTDQERYLQRFPDGLMLPGHERLRKNGVTFHNHHCPAVMCTSSRAVLVTGLQTADNRMFENCDMPYVKAMPTSIPTIGHLLRKAGYYSAYKGKWHLDAAFDADEPRRSFDKEMDAYGFSDFGLPVDGQAHALGGFMQDQMIAGSAVSWLREKGRALSDAGKPWSLFVSLVNPHDIMYFNTDAPGQDVQDTGKLLMHAARAPEHAWYAQRWNVPLPGNLREAFDAPGRPAAHGEFHRAWGYTLGAIPDEKPRWDRFNDFYFNSLRSVDRQLVTLLDELAALGLEQDTIVVFTSDHGEMGGAHGLRGKGPMAYKENIHIPMYIVHPDVEGGQDCRALTGHIDLVPTLLAMAGMSPQAAADAAGRELPGKDLGPLFTRPGAAATHAIRDSILFTYSGLATNDSELIRIIAEAKSAGKDPKAAVKATGYKPDMKKRGSLRTVFDGQHKFTRYFSPLERNSPRDLDELFRWNDVELFDLANDPDEMHNLATDRAANASRLLAMNGKLEAAIKAEIGVDDAREMPMVAGIDWTLDRIDL